MTDIFNIPNDEHVAIAGRTGTGKTQVCRVLLARKTYVIVLDTKGLFYWPEVPGTKWDNREKYKHILLDGGPELTLIDRLELLPRVKTPKIIYRPKWEELTLDFYNAFYQWCYRRGNNVVYTDELMSVCENPFKYPEYLKAIMTRGRELKVPHWGATQRPANIAAVTMSEASHFFVFDLNLATDRKKMVDISGVEEFNVKPSTLPGADKHSFWYYNVEVSSLFPARLKLKK